VNAGENEAEEELTWMDRTDRIRLISYLKSEIRNLKSCILFILSIPVEFPAG